MTGLKSIQNKVQSAPKLPKKPSKVNALLDEVVKLSKLLERTINNSEVQLAVRDVTIAELRGLVTSQAESLGELRTAYAAQGEVIARIDGQRATLTNRADEMDAAIEDLVRIETSIVSKHDAHAQLIANIALRAEGTATAVEALEIVFNGLAGDLGQVRADSIKHLAELGAHVNTLDQAQTVRVQAIREKIAEDLTAMHAVAQEAVMEARGEVVSMFGQAHNERAEAETRTIERLVAVENRTAELDRGLQAIERDGLVEQIKDVAASVETLAQRSIAAIEHQDKTLRAWIASVDDDAQDAFNQRVATIEAAAGELTVRVDRIEKDCDLLQTETEQQITGVGEQLAQTHNTLTGDVAGVRSALQDLRERLRSTVSTLPKSLLVDTDGDLVAIDGNGEPQRIGKVMGKRGRNGAELLDAEMRDGCLVLRMTDGRKVVTQNLLLQVVQEVQGTVVGNLQKAGIPDKQIAALFGKQPVKSQRVKNEGQVREPAPRRAARSKQPDLDRAGKQ